VSRELANDTQNGLKKYLGKPHDAVHLQVSQPPVNKQQGNCTNAASSSITVSAFVFRQLGGTFEPRLLSESYGQRLTVTLDHQCWFGRGGDDHHSLSRPCGHGGEGGIPNIGATGGGTIIIHSHARVGMGLRCTNLVYPMMTGFRYTDPTVSDIPIPRCSATGTLLGCNPSFMFNSSSGFVVASLSLVNNCFATIPKCVAQFG